MNNKLLQKIQKKHRRYFCEELFERSKNRFLDSVHLPENGSDFNAPHIALFTFEQDISKLNPLAVIIEKRYLKEVEERQVSLFENFDLMLERQWFQFISKMLDYLLAEEENFYLTVLILSDYIFVPQRRNDWEYARSYMHKLDLGQFYSDERFDPQELRYE